jgi:phosphoglycerol transferase MdoB-like AlkP superfamily enzyme
LGIFRCLPQFAKRAFFEYGGLQQTDMFLRSFLRERPTPSDANTAKNKFALLELGPDFVLDNDFLEMAKGNATRKGGITSTAARPVFKFYHLSGLHVPVKMNRDLIIGHYDYSRANFSQQAEGYAKIMGTFMDGLRRANVYDNSMIIILGDHGSGRDQQLYTNPGPPERTDRLNRTSANKDFQGDKARGLPLLLIKRFGANGEIYSSRVPASLIDIPATVLADLNIYRPPVAALVSQPEFQGMPLFALREGQSRTRYYGAMHWAAKRSDYASPITLYRVEGNSWLDESWSFERILEHKD